MVDYWQAEYEVAAEVFHDNSEVDMDNILSRMDVDFTDNTDDGSVAARNGTWLVPLWPMRFLYSFFFIQWMPDAISNYAA
jgi:hypothetical protein